MTNKKSNSEKIVISYSTNAKAVIKELTALEKVALRLQKLGINLSLKS